MRRLLPLLASLSLLVGCPSDDDDATVTCGDGTHLMGSECMPDGDDDDATGDDDDDATDDDDDDATDDDDVTDDDDDDNQPPSPPDIGVVPGSPLPDDELLCFLSIESEDPDGDEVYYDYDWLLDGVDSGYGGSNIPMNVIGAGEEWACVVVAYDGELESDPAVFTVLVEANAAPSVPVIEVTPENPGSDDNLVCSITTAAVDPDGDLVTYEFTWEVDSTDSGITATVVDASVTETGQTWTCHVLAEDPDHVTSSAADTVVIGP